MYQEIKGFSKIGMIKAIRQYCFDTFGVTPGLKVSKEVADDIFATASSQIFCDLEKAIAAAKAHGLTYSQIEAKISLAF